MHIRVHIILTPMFISHLSKKIIAALATIIFVILTMTQPVLATSGACSWHSGVDCSAGADWDGSVICKDGWRDSSVQYSDSCSNEEPCPVYVQQEEFDSNKKMFEDSIQRIEQNTQQLCEDSFQREQALNDQSYQSCEASNDNLRSMYSRIGFPSSPSGFQDCEALRVKATDIALNNKNFCLTNDDGIIFKYRRLLFCQRLDTTDYCPLQKINSHSKDGQCICNDGYIPNGNQCIASTSQSDELTQRWLDNYIRDKALQRPAAQQIELEIKQQAPKDIKLTNRLRGRILLQVENNGEAWYLDGTSGKRYYMANGNEAYNALRKLGTGITNKDLARIQVNKLIAKKHAGKIFLQVESFGEAYYIDFDGNAHYLENGEAAYNIMRTLGLGIKNQDLRKIEIGSLDVK